jgi:hypothetical protein
MATINNEVVVLMSDIVYQALACFVRSEIKAWKWMGFVVIKY